MITEREFLERARLDRRNLGVWIEEEWLIPARPAGELAFTDMDLARASLIRDLKDNMGVNDEGLGVVLHLLDQMHPLSRALAAGRASAPERRPLSDRWLSLFPGGLRRLHLRAHQPIEVFGVENVTVQVGDP